MKTANVADLRNNFRKLSAWLEHGETVQILKRGRPFAHLTTIPAPVSATKPDIMAQIREVWGDKVFTTEEVEAALEAARGGEEG